MTWAVTLGGWVSQASEAVPHLTRNGAEETQEAGEAGSRGARGCLRTGSQGSRGQAEMSGGVVSRTVTVEDLAAVLEQLSLAVNVTLVAAPAAQAEGNRSGASSNREAPSQTSEARTRANQSWMRLSDLGTPPGLVH